jgi:hypothetical protein
MRTLVLQRLRPRRGGGETAEERLLEQIYQHPLVRVLSEIAALSGLCAALDTFVLRYGPQAATVALAPIFRDLARTLPTVAATAPDVPALAPLKRGIAALGHVSDDLHDTLAALVRDAETRAGQGETALAAKAEQFQLPGGGADPATAQGSPFWFDILKKTVNARTSGPTFAEDEKRRG